jgi:hypothetical protein
MHTCFTPVRIYGFIDTEHSRDKIIPEYVLKQDVISAFALDIVRGYAGEVIYGIEVGLDDSISSEDKIRLENIIHKYSGRYSVQFHPPGYFLAISGDYSICHTVYAEDV